MVPTLIYSKVPCSAEARLDYSMMSLLINNKLNNSKVDKISWYGIWIGTFVIGWIYEYIYKPEHKN